MEIIDSPGLPIYSWAPRLEAGAVEQARNRSAPRLLPPRGGHGRRPSGLRSPPLPTRSGAPGPLARDDIMGRVQAAVPSGTESRRDSPGVPEVDALLDAAFDAMEEAAELAREGAGRPLVREEFLRRGRSHLRTLGSGNHTAGSGWARVTPWPCGLAHQADLVEPVLRLMPLATYKGADPPDDGRRRGVPRRSGSAARPTGRSSSSPGVPMRIHHEKIPNREVSPLRRLRIVAPIQLAMVMPELASTPAQRWSALPDDARTTALSVLARMIAIGVVEEEVTDAGEH